MSPVMEDIEMENNQIVGFTQADRDKLTSVHLELHYIKERIDQVAIKTKELEDSKVSIKELENLWIEIDELKKDKITAEARLKTVEDWKLSTVSTFQGGKWVIAVLWTLLLFGAGLLGYIIKKP